MTDRIMPPDLMPRAIHTGRCTAAIVASSFELDDASVDDLMRRVGGLVDGVMSARTKRGLGPEQDPWDHVVAGFIEGLLRRSKRASDDAHIILVACSMADAWMDAATEPPTSAAAIVPAI